MFELYDDIERLRAQDKSIVDFELDYLDDIRLGNDAEEANNVSASKNVIEEKVENEPEMIRCWMMLNCVIIQFRLMMKLMIMTMGLKMYMYQMCQATLNKR